MRGASGPVTGVKRDMPDSRFSTGFGCPHRAVDGSRPGRRAVVWLDASLAYASRVGAGVAWSFGLAGHRPNARVRTRRPAAWRSLRLGFAIAARVPRSLPIALLGCKEVGNRDCFARQDVSAGLRSDGARLRSPRGSLAGWRRAPGQKEGGIRSADPATLDGRAGGCSAADGVRAAESRACRQPHHPRLRAGDRRIAPTRARRARSAAPRPAIADANSGDESV
jgi:hypothetical protein